METLVYTVKQPQLDFIVIINWSTSEQAHHEEKVTFSHTIIAVDFGPGPMSRQCSSDV